MLPAHIVTYLGELLNHVYTNGEETELISELSAYQSKWAKQLQESDDTIIYAITKGDVQEIAMDGLGRRITLDEMERVTDELPDQIVNNH